MTWFKVDDSFYDHPKVFDAPDCALALWVRAGSWSARNLTDGFVPAKMPARFCDDPDTAVRELVDRGLWRRTKGGYRFHDWTTYQPTKEEAQRKSSGGRLGNHRRWHVDRGIADPGCPYCQHKPGSDNRSDTDHSADRSSESGPNPPVPSRPVPKGRVPVGDHSAGDQSVRAGARTREAARWLNLRYGLTDDESALVVAEVQRRAGEIRASVVAYMQGMTENGTLADIVGAVQTAADQPPQPSVHDSQPLVVVPDWCGRCDERTRMVEVGDEGRPMHCPDCHWHREAS